MATTKQLIVPAVFCGAPVGLIVAIVLFRGVGLPPEFAMLLGMPIGFVAALLTLKSI